MGSGFLADGIQLENHNALNKDDSVNMHPEYWKRITHSPVFHSPVARTTNNKRTSYRHALLFMAQDVNLALAFAVR